MTIFVTNAGLQILARVTWQRAATLLASGVARNMLGPPGTGRAFPEHHTGHPQGRRHPPLGVPALGGQDHRLLRLPAHDPRPRQPHLRLLRRPRRHRRSHRPAITRRRFNIRQPGRRLPRRQPTQGRPHPPGRRAWRCATHPSSTTRGHSIRPPSTSCSPSTTTSTPNQPPPGTRRHERSLGWCSAPPPQRTPLPLHPHERS